ncbi:MAG: 3,4-dihydroxy-2-butanone-4-phosphate synthase [Legionella sp.]
MTSVFNTIEQALLDLKNGLMIILVDDEDRENEGDLVIAAQYANADAINFMTQYGRGLICLPMENEMVDKLQLPMMASTNRSPYGTAFTVSIEAAKGVTTGISTADRARTIQVAIDENTKPNDLISPGHIFPLRAQTGGVLARCGQTEGSVDLMRIAGLIPAAVICEILNDDGTMSRREELALFAKRHHLSMVSIRDLINYRIQNEQLVTELATTRIPLAAHGDFNMSVFSNRIDNAEHFILSKPIFDEQQPPLVRIHSECITGDIFGSCKCDCGEQLNQSLQLIAAQGGVLIYLRQEGRGIGLANKLKAYALQEQGLDTVEANEQLGLPVDNRDYSVAFQLLKYLGLTQVRLLTNNPKKIDSIVQYGINVTERLPLITKITRENCNYLKTKKEKLGHLFD